MGAEAVTISPSITGAASSVLGLGAGYVLAPRKYSLERLLMQNDDSFNKTFSPEVMKHATEGEKHSLANLKEASKTYHSSGDMIMKEQITPNAKLWHEMVKKVNVEDKFVSEVDMRKTAYLQSLQETNYRAHKKKLDIAQKKALMYPKDVNANLEMKAASRDFAAAQIALEHPSKQYRDARAAFRAAREEAFLKLPDSGRAISSQWDKVRRALSDRATIMYGKLSTLTKNENLHKDYSLVKKYIPKARTYSALMGGILAGITGVIVGVCALNKMRSA